MDPVPSARFAVALAAVTLIGPLAVHLFLPVVPAVKGEFGVSDALAELSFSVTLAAMAFATLVYGTLSDRFGRRHALLSGLGLFLAGSVTAALSGSVAVLIAGRLVQAVGAGCSITLTRAIARDAYGAEHLVKAIAYLTMAYTLGPMVAPAVGGYLADHLGWRSVFWFALASGGAITVAAALVLHETRRGAGPRRSGILRDYGVLLADPRFAAFVLQSGFCSGTFFAMAAASPFLMQGALGRSATAFGLYFFCYPAGYCIGNLISSRVAGRVSIETMVLTGSLVNLAAVGVQAGFVVGGTLSPLVIFLPGAFVTFAQGLALPNAQAGAMQVRPDLAGTAAGMGVFVQTLFMALFAQLYGSLADGTAYPMVAVAALAAVSSAVCGAVPLLLQRRPVPDRI
ncbi:MAG TPA: multidrug effflux MFS transporter [Stellaceae bacterium]|nr:multidrug effflux MFS transporter [Stellaceae bacterium]